MPRTKGTIERKRVDPFAEMVKAARKGGHLWTPHLNADGQCFTVTRSEKRPTRDEIIQGAMAVAEVVCTKVDGVWQYTEPHYPTCAEAERFAPLIRTETAA